MNVYRVRREKGTTGYDQFDSFVCVAIDERHAATMMPSFVMDAEPESREGLREGEYDPHEWTWPAHEGLVVDLIAANAEGPARVVLSSFNAG